MPVPIPRFEDGFRLINGTHLNKLVDQLNAMSSGFLVVNQATPTALTVSALLTAAQLLTGLLTANQGAAGAAAYQLPTAANLNALVLTTAPGGFQIGQSFDFTLVNVSTVAAEAASITTNTGWTLVGDMDVAANSAATTKSAGRFRAKKTAATTWTLYRLS